MEVDFCVPKAGLLVQVSYRMTENVTRNREISALQKVGRFLNAKRLMIITYDQEETIPSSELDMNIEVVPVCKFCWKRRCFDKSEQIEVVGLYINKANKYYTILCSKIRTII